MKRLGLILAALLGLAVQAVPASADIQYTLNCSTSSCAGNYGSVTLSTPGAAGTIHVAVQLTSGYQFGGNNTQALLWNGSASSLTLSNGTSGFGASGVQSNANYTAVSPFTGGSNFFDFRVERSNNSGSPTALNFDVTKSGGLSLGDFITNFSGGYYFAAWIHQDSTNTNFYVASNGPGVRVPEPSSVTLSIAGLAGLMGLIMLQRRRKLIRAV